VAGLAALVLAGCGAAASGPDPSVAAPPSADPFTSALIMSRSWASAQMEATVLSTVEGVTRMQRARGEVGIDKGYAWLTWHEAGRVSTEIVNDRGSFRQEQSPDGGWVYSAPGAATPTAALADPLRHLTELQGVVEQGSDSMDGFDATRYAGTLPLTGPNLDGLTLTEDEKALVLAGAAPQDAVQVTMWLDPNRRLVRIDRSLETGVTSPLDASVLASTHLWDFGIMIHVEPPPSASVTATVTSPR
jgi:hypothetical protein